MWHNFFIGLSIEICLAGAESRVGKKREDLPWVEEKLDDEFKQVILNFSKEKLPHIYELIENYKNNKKIVIFKSREEAEEYISKVKRHKGKAIKNNIVLIGE